MLFLGSYFLLRFILSPLFAMLLNVGMHAFPASSATNSAAATGTHSELQTASDFMSSLFVFLYYVLWLMPIYVLSILLNALWYKDIAQAVFVIVSNRTPPSASQPVALTAGITAGASAGEKLGGPDGLKSPPPAPPPNSFAFFVNAMAEELYNVVRSDFEGAEISSSLHAFLSRRIAFAPPAAFVHHAAPPLLQHHPAESAFSCF